MRHGIESSNTMAHARELLDSAQLRPQSFDLNWHRMGHTTDLHFSKKRTFRHSPPRDLRWLKWRLRRDQWLIDDQEEEKEKEKGRGHVYIFSSNGLLPSSCLSPCLCWLRNHIQSSRRWSTRTRSSTAELPTDGKIHRVDKKHVFPSISLSCVRSMLLFFSPLNSTAMKRSAWWIEERERSWCWGLMRQREREREQQSRLIVSFYIWVLYWLLFFIII